MVAGRVCGTHSCEAAVRVQTPQACLARVDRVSGASRLQHLPFTVADAGETVLAAVWLEGAPTAALPAPRCFCGPHPTSCPAAGD